MRDLLRAKYRDDAIVDDRAALEKLATRLAKKDREGNIARIVGSVLMDELEAEA